jgi:hypothetical protein
MIGKFDESFIICGSDVEICLRAYDAGLFNLYDANVRLYHLESKSRDSYIPEVDFQRSYECYTPYRENIDPYYNPNLDINFVKPQLRVEGLMHIDQFKNYLKRNKLAHKLLESARRFYADMTHTPDIPEITRIDGRRFDALGESLRLNLMVPSLSEQHVFGGISTALHFFEALIKNLDVRSRIIVTDAMYDSKHSVKLDSYQLVDCDEDSLLDRQIVSFSDRHKRTIPVGERDVFVCTGWWTAYTISDVLLWQSEEYKRPLNTMIYLIQDHESGFYPWSSRYLLVESTYQSDIPKIAVFNSKLLMDNMQHSDYHFVKQLYFDPALNPSLSAYLSQNWGKSRKKKKVIVYGRPSTPRNAFELVVLSLIEWSKIQPDIREWELISMGEDHPDIPLSEGVTLSSTGKASLERYAQIMLESYMGISLMVSPHPSYPPLEMSAFGVRTITNAFENKDLTRINDNIISLENCSPHNIAVTLKKLADQYTEDATYYYDTPYAISTTVFDDICSQIKEAIFEGGN